MRPSRKILVPLSTLSAADAVAVGSGASFTSQSGNTIGAIALRSLGQLVAALRPGCPDSALGGRVRTV